MLFLFPIFLFTVIKETWALSKPGKLPHGANYIESELTFSPVNRADPSQSKRSNNNNNDNPNVIQNIMAQEFIKCSTNLFSKHEANVDDRALCALNFFGHVDSVKPRLKHSARDKIRRKETAASSKTHLYKIQNVSSASSDSQLQVVRCRRGPTMYNFRLPRKLKSERSISSVIREIYRNLTGQDNIKMGNVNPFVRVIGPHKTERKVRDSFNFTKTYQRLNSQENKVRPFSDNRIKSLEVLNQGPHQGKLFVNEENHDPPPELTISDKDKGKMCSKWLSRRDINDVSFHGIMKHGGNMNMEECHHSRCRRTKCTTSHRPSANEGKTAKIMFPSSHRCMRQTCPCRVTKLCVPPRTTCPSSPLIVEPTTGRCEGQDMIMTMKGCKDKLQETFSESNLLFKRDNDLWLNSSVFTSKSALFVRKRDARVSDSHQVWQRWHSGRHLSLDHSFTLQSVSDKQVNNIPAVVHAKPQDDYLNMEPNMKQITSKNKIMDSSSSYYELSPSPTNRIKEIITSETFCEVSSVVEGFQQPEYQFVSGKSVPDTTLKKCECSAECSCKTMQCLRLLESQAVANVSATCPFVCGCFAGHPCVIPRVEARRCVLQK